MMNNKEILQVYNELVEIDYVDPIGVLAKGYIQTGLDNAPNGKFVGWAKIPADDYMLLGVSLSRILPIDIANVVALRDSFLLLANGDDVEAVFKRQLGSDYSKMEEAREYVYNKLFVTNDTNSSSIGDVINSVATGDIIGTTTPANRADSSSIKRKLRKIVGG